MWIAISSHLCDIVTHGIVFVACPYHYSRGNLLLATSRQQALAVNNCEGMRIYIYIYIYVYTHNVCISLWLYNMYVYIYIYVSTHMCIRIMCMYIYTSIAIACHRPLIPLSANSCLSTRLLLLSRLLRASRSTPTSPRWRSKRWAPWRQQP